MPKLRLNKILAQAGLTSRRGGDRLILDGHVAVNGALTRELGTLADPVRDVITVDGRPVPPAASKRYVMLHKPRGYVTTRHDPQGRLTVSDLVTVAGLYPVGRLDADVEGLLLLTNDGPLTHRLLHPSYGLPRLYDAEVAGEVRPGDVASWRRGVTLRDGAAKPLAVELRQSAPERSRLHLIFAEGRKHEVKRYCEALGHPVIRLRRVGFGPLRLDGLAVGAWRDLTRNEIAVLRAAVSRPPEGS
jgi:23S rRNA pseudouridine2605 synthase